MRGILLFITPVLLGACTDELPLEPRGGEPLPSFTTIATGFAHTCALTGQGTAYCWGLNGGGQVGDGTEIDRFLPVPVSGSLHFTAISLGVVHTCGITDEQEAYCWGRNWLGRLGDGTVVNRSAPTLVTGGLRWSAIQAGSEHTCGLTTAGIAYCWGYRGWHGSLGDGSAAGTWRASPVKVAGGHTFAALSADGASFHTCALTRQREAYCWGRNFDGDFTGGGQLGDGTTTDRSIPVRVADTLRFRTLTIGSGHTCGLTAVGAVYCWGMNGTGELGDGTTTHRLTPVATLGSVVFGSVAAGSHTCALTTAGAATCWGWNLHGELGDGTTTTRLTPVQVAGGLSFAVLSVGGGHTCGLAAAGPAYCWGRNWAGQLGDGTTTDSSLPVKVAGLRQGAMASNSSLKQLNRRFHGTL